MLSIVNGSVGRGRCGSVFEPRQQRVCRESPVKGDKIETLWQRSSYRGPAVSVTSRSQSNRGPQVIGLGSQVSSTVGSTLWQRSSYRGPAVSVTSRSQSNRGPQVIGLGSQVSSTVTDCNVLGYT